MRKIKWSIRALKPPTTMHYSQPSVASLTLCPRYQTVVLPRLVIQRVSDCQSALGEVVVSPVMK